ncbi:hypothetical protein ACP4OV_018141 [Aristida adscensionis]
MRLPPSRRKLSLGPCPDGNTRTAAFMGCPFSKAKEEAGTVDAIVELCAFDRQWSAEVNRSGAYVINGECQQRAPLQERDGG